jgi:CRISPR-associated protein Cas1
VKRHLNTLFVTTQGAYLAKEGECVVVRMDGKDRLKVPLHTLDGVVCFGQVGCSPFLLGACAERDVCVSLLTERGRFLAQVRGPASGNVLLRREQYRRADDPGASADVSRAIIAGKLANSRQVLMRFVRDHEQSEGAEEVRAVAADINGLLERVLACADLDALRGFEGEGAARYFAVFDQLIVAEGESFRFAGRNRRPPLDPVNCLLSFVYTLLLHDVRSALESTGLDPCVGFLHRDRPGLPGLALDMMEEFRSFLADRLVLSLINREQVRGDGFTTSETGGVFMDDETRRTVLTAYQKRKQEDIMHPFLKERMTLGLAFHVQARLLARALRGDLDGYPAFMWR